MRGEIKESPQIFCMYRLGEKIRGDRPLREIKRTCDELLKTMNVTFERMYSTTGRPSIPPEILLKSQLLIALHSVRSDRLFCEQLDYNFLFRWFLDMEGDEARFDHSTFSKNRERLLKHEVAERFFERVVKHARENNLLLDDHFTVDGTLIESLASLKSFRRKGGSSSRGRRKQPDSGFPREETEQRDACFEHGS